MCKSRLLSVTEVAEHLDVSRQTVHRWIKDGKLPAIRIGDRIKIDPESLSAVVQPVVVVDDSNDIDYHSDGAS